MSRSADDVALDHDHFSAEPRRGGGRNVARRSATDDHESNAHVDQVTSAVGGLERPLPGIVFRSRGGDRDQ